MKLNLVILLFITQLHSSYFIAIKENIGDILNTLNSYTPFIPPKGKYYADPFLFKFEGTNYLFFEDYDYKKGVISVSTLSSTGEISKPKLALELPTHLSFPFVFSDNDQIYMIPETFRYRSVSLYKAVQFPSHWEHERVLIHGEKFSDSILFKYCDYYWLFTAIHMDRLQIYFAKDLNSPFFPHPINHRNIKGRNAGSVFYMGNRLIRPTMDCSKHYGERMILKEILLLTPNKFIETEIGTIDPTWAPNLHGTHTFSQNDDYVVYDGETAID